jgi:hypothetical protein
MSKTLLSARQVKALIKAVGHKRTVLVEGEAGAGKTSIHYQLAADPHFARYYAPKPIDCTQLSDGSIVMPDLDRSRGVSRELPNERLGVSDENHAGVEGARPVLMCFDEIAKSRQFIKDTIAPIVYERRVGNYMFAEGSVVWGATNLTEEGLGDMMQAHLRNRIIIVTMRKPTKDEWVQDFALPRSLNENIIAAAEMYPMIFNSFMDFRPGGAFAGKTLRKENPFINDPADAAQEQVVTPRSLHTASDLVDEMAHIDNQTLQAALEGTVGAAFAANIMSMIRFGESLPSFDRVVADPGGSPLPTNPTAQIVQIFQFLTQVKDKEMAEQVSVYVQRMREEMKSLFVNSVVNSTLMDKFALSKTFGLALTQNRQYLGQ